MHKIFAHSCFVSLCSSFDTGAAQQCIGHALDVWSLEMFALYRNVLLLCDFDIGVAQQCIVHALFALLSCSRCGGMKVAEQENVAIIVVCNRMDCTASPTCSLVVNYSSSLRAHENHHSLLMS